MKRIPTLVAALFTAVALGCGGGNPDSPKQPDPTTGIAQPPLKTKNGRPQPPPPPPIQPAK